MFYINIYKLLLILLLNLIIHTQAQLRFTDKSIIDPNFWLAKKSKRPNNKQVISTNHIIANTQPNHKKVPVHFGTPYPFTLVRRTDPFWYGDPINLGTPIDVVWERRI